MSKKEKFYAVKRGRKTGIYRTWAECQKQVNHYSNACFKSFPIKEEALRYLGQNNTDNHQKHSYKNFKKKMLDKIMVVDPQGIGSFVIMDKETGEILDDDAGLTYSNKQDALDAFANKSKNYSEWPYGVDQRFIKREKHKPKFKVRPAEEAPKLDIELNDEQKKAYQLIKSGANVFISGSAGVGKSSLLQYVIEHSANKETRICAPTGISAVNVGGVTIHRLLGLRLSQDIIYKKQHKLPNALKKVDRVIVDEISMCRADLFNWLSQSLRIAEKRNKKPIQLIIVGDFCQLPPVVATKYDKQYFAGEKKYAFSTQEWKSWDFKTILLHEVMRQHDLQFIDALNEIRVGNSAGLKYIKEKSASSELQDAITLTSRNVEAEKINLNKLSQLKSKEHSFYSLSEGTVDVHEKPVPDKITLKKGAQVICMTNEANGRYQNGTIAKVIKFVKDDDGNDCVIVKLDNGDTPLIKPHTWNVYNYLPAPDDPTFYVKSLVGKYTQIPVKLGYAITIHKSQGQTYDRVNLYPAGWTSGLLYVALSRVRSVDKLFLERNITRGMVNTDPAVIDFYKQNE